MHLHLQEEPAYVIKLLKLNKKVTLEQLVSKTANSQENCNPRGGKKRIINGGAKRELSFCFVMTEKDRK